MRVRGSFISIVRNAGDDGFAASIFTAEHDNDLAGLQARERKKKACVNKAKAKAKTTTNRSVKNSNGKREKGFKEPYNFTISACFEFRIKSLEKKQHLN